MGRVALNPTRRATFVLLLCASGVLIIDQVTKALARATLGPPGAAARTVALIPGVLELTYVRNTGAAFGLLPGRQPVFMVVSVLVVLVVAGYWAIVRPRSLWLAVALGLAGGGALGNLIDRFSSGRVTDFIDIQVLPVFNVADSGIVVGTIMLVALVLLDRGDGPAPEAGAQQAAARGEASEDGDRTDA